MPGTARSAGAHGADSNDGAAGGEAEVRFDRSVFVNCPFDDDFLPLLHALLFAIHDCGFIARTAVEDAGSNETRVDKIVRIIGDSRYSIHDISRVELGGATRLSRFNMPFECGLAMGSIRFGATRPDQARDFLLLTGVPFQDKLTLSDLAGQDPRSHEGTPKLVIAAVRSFLAAKAAHAAEHGPVRGATSILRRFEMFNTKLPGMAAAVEITDTEIRSFDYLRDWTGLMSTWIMRSPRSERRSTASRRPR